MKGYSSSASPPVSLTATKSSTPAKGFQASQMEIDAPPSTTVISQEKPKSASDSENTVQTSSIDGTTGVQPSVIPDYIDGTTSSVDLLDTTSLAATASPKLVNNDLRPALEMEATSTLIGILQTPHEVVTPKGVSAAPPTRTWAK